ncbi:hypothetical protein EXIGLDRAFT_777896 [Exidia glandulosa HHB12029]|uniref:Uncharacterized protein n=1 Tax=Exidia glandulosa HHB12029 TaxID=1314781 RepID=A0A165CTX3_EXIGL|nr:hypothetical protein EXIGLDRAFT_777896 [Exidia glandulosa HHB12029]
MISARCEPLLIQDCVHTLQANLGIDVQTASRLYQEGIGTDRYACFLPGIMPLNFPSTSESLVSEISTTSLAAPGTCVLAGQYRLSEHVLDFASWRVLSHAEISLKTVLSLPVLRLPSIRTPEMPLSLLLAIFWTSVMQGSGVTRSVRYYQAFNSSLTNPILENSRDSRLVLDAVRCAASAQRSRTPAQSSNITAAARRIKSFQCVSLPRDRRLRSLCPIRGRVHSFHVISINATLFGAGANRARQIVTRYD